MTFNLTTTGKMNALKILFPHQLDRRITWVINAEDVNVHGKIQCSQIAHNIQSTHNIQSAHNGLPHSWNFRSAPLLWDPHLSQKAKPDFDVHEPLCMFSPPKFLTVRTDTAQGSATLVASASRERCQSEVRLVFPSQNPFSARRQGWETRVGPADAALFPVNHDRVPGAAGSAIGVHGGFGGCSQRRHFRALTLPLPSHGANLSR